MNGLNHIKRQQVSHLNSAWDLTNIRAIIQSYLSYLFLQIIIESESLSTEKYNIDDQCRETLLKIKIIYKKVCFNILSQ